MGYRTLSLDLVLRALFLDDRAFDQMRDDDNPFVEGLFLVVIIAALTAVFALIGESLAWASSPRIADIKQVVFEMLRQAPWMADTFANPQALQSFLPGWDQAWNILPTIFGAPSPLTSAVNILAWPFFGIIAWLVYGIVAHLIARLFDGVGSLSQTLGVTALAFAPWMFHGLQLVPYLVLGGFVATWQLILRYKAIRSVHQLSWDRAMWVTVLPFLILITLAVLVGGSIAALTAIILGRR